MYSPTGQSRKWPVPAKSAGWIHQLHQQQHQSTWWCSHQEVRQCTSKHFLSNQQKSSYLPLVYRESLLWSIFFHFEMFMIENKNTEKGKLVLFFSSFFLHQQSIFFFFSFLLITRQSLGLTITSGKHTPANARVKDKAGHAYRVLGLKKWRTPSVPVGFMQLLSNNLHYKSKQSIPSSSNGNYYLNK